MRYHDKTGTMSTLFAAIWDQGYIYLTKKTFYYYVIDYKYSKASGTGKFFLRKDNLRRYLREKYGNTDMN
jgi:hypothetical protein